jgi:hypothetical protein
LLVVEAFKEELGVDDTNTLASMNSLALTFLDQGRRGEADRLQVQAMKACKSKLGVGHLDTLTSINNIAVTYLNQE